jgi:hypothetical protein
MNQHVNNDDRDGVTFHLAHRHEIIVSEKCQAVTSLKSRSVLISS